VWTCPPRGTANEVKDAAGHGPQCANSRASLRAVSGLGACPASMVRELWPRTASSEEHPDGSGLPFGGGERSAARRAVARGLSGHSCFGIADPREHAGGRTGLYGLSGSVRVGWKVMATDELGSGHPRGLRITEARALDLVHLSASGLRRLQPNWPGGRRRSPSGRRHLPRDESACALLAGEAAVPGEAPSSPKCGASLSRRRRHGCSSAPRSCVVRFRSGKWQILGTTALHWTTGSCTRLHVVAGQTRKQGRVG
jgi:hypothetical protein